MAKDDQRQPTPIVDLLASLHVNLETIRLKALRGQVGASSLLPAALRTARQLVRDGVPQMADVVALLEQAHGEQYRLDRVQALVTSALEVARLAPAGLERVRNSGMEEKSNELLLIADLDAVPAGVVAELMGALDHVHRAYGGGGLEIRTVNTGSTAIVGVGV